jgi:DNA-binding NtrC family response regulator
MTWPSLRIFVAMQSKEKTILIADKSQLSRDVLSRFFRAHDYAVFLAESGPEAVQTLLDRVVGLAIMDVLLFDGDSSDLIGLIEEHSPSVKLILIKDDWYPPVFLREGSSAVAVFTRPIDPSALLNVVARTLKAD